MAIRLIDQYPNRVGTPDADYPHGVPRNKSAPTAADGTPYEQSWFRDQEGFFQGLVESAGITPSGTPDTVQQSDYLDALVQVSSGVTEIDVSGDQDVTVDFKQSRIFALKLTGALAGDIDLIVPDDERIYWVIDETTGGFSVTVRTAGGSGITLSEINSVVRSDGTNVVSANTGVGETESQWLGAPVGSYISLRTDIPGVDEPPTNDSRFRYVKLTAGLDGAGQYNEGFLTNESVSGSAPLVVATAEIAAGPLTGQTISLLNSENRYVMPGTSSGAVANDQMQQITGSINGNISDGLRTDFHTGAGAFSVNPLPNIDSVRPDWTNDINGATLAFDSANSPDGRAGDHTNVKHQQATHYMRIQ